MSRTWARIARAARRPAPGASGGRLARSGRLLEDRNDADAHLHRPLSLLQERPIGIALLPGPEGCLTGPLLDHQHREFRLTLEGLDAPADDRATEAGHLRARACLVSLEQLLVQHFHDLDHD